MHLRKVVCKLLLSFMIILNIGCKQNLNPVKSDEVDIIDNPTPIPTFTTTEINNNMVVLTERYSNSKNSFQANILLLHGDQGNLIVDSGIPSKSDKLKNTIDHINNKDLRYIINTHDHGDHIGGNSLLSNNDTLIFHEDGYIFYTRSNSECQLIPINSEYIFHFNNEKIICYALSFDGHSVGDLLVYFPKSNVICVGDLYFSESFPYVDVAKGAKIDYLRGNYEIIESLINSETKIVPGHGKISDREDFLEYIQMVNQTVSIVRQHIRNGKTESEIIALDVLKDYKNWEDNRVNTLNTEFWIGTIYNDYMNSSS